MKTLVIAEKPDMGRSIAAAIEPKAVNKRTHLEGQQYIITWAIGHLLGLAEPDHYNDKYKKWSIQDLPIIPERFKLVPNPRTKSQLDIIRELAGRSEALINACDAGREGQLIFSYIQQHLGLRQPVKRLWISDLTPETIRKGFAELREGSDFEPLTRAARSRSIADWLIGMNGSRAFTTKHNVLLSVGRVQTPVLALIYDRQIEIERFDSQVYFEVYGYFRQGQTNYRGIWQGERITDAAQAEELRAKVDARTGVIEKYERKEAKEYPWKLYDLTLLQREANGKLGFSAKKTLELAQSLYEKHKVISYPRTNSNYVTEQNIPEMHRALSALQGTEYEPLVKEADRSLVHKGNKAICDPAKVEDHHAILPTSKRAPAGLSPEERKLYDMIIRRFLSHFYPPARYDVHTIMTKIESELFKTTVKQLLEMGWKKLYEKDKQESTDSEEEQLLEGDFQLDPGLAVTCTKAEAKEKKTNPPKPYTEGTLLKAMESAGRMIEQEEAREAMKDAGLGTPATRAAVIERLKQVEYINMQGKRICITNKGRTAIELIRAAGIELLTSPVMTGAWEKRLNEIARGSASDDQFLERVKQFACKIVDQVRVQQRADRARFENTKAAPAASGSPRSKAADKPVAVKEIGACLRNGCGGTVITGRKGFGCNRYKEGCTFVIWKEFHGGTVTEAMAKALLEKGKTRPVKLEDGKRARLIVADRETGAIAIEPEA